MSYGADAYGVESYGSTPSYSSVDTEPDTIILLETTPDTWLDISHDFMYGNTIRGKQRELDRYQAGTASITLLNNSRDYDPNNAASPYNGYVKPRKRIQVLSLFNGVFDSHFMGYINRWVQDYSQHNTARTTIEATDGFLIFAGADLPSSAYALEVLEDNPYVWFRLGESSDSTVAIDSIQGISTEAVVGPGTFGAQGLVSREADTAFSSTVGTSTSGLPITNKRALVDGLSSFSVEFVFQSTNTASEQMLFIQASSANELTAFGVAPTGSGGEVLATINDFQVAGNANINDGEVHHVVVTWEAGLNPDPGLTDTVRIYVDGVLDFDDFDIGDTATISGTFGSLAGDTYGLYGVPSLIGTLDEFTIYDYVLSAERIAAHAEAVSTPWNNDLGGERITRILDNLNWDALLRSIDAGETTLQSASLATTALEHLQKVAESEFGAFFIAKDGRATFKSRHDLINLASSATFGDDPTDVTELPYRSVTPEYSEELIRNDVTISRAEGTAQNVRDQDSIDEYQRKSYTLEGLLYDDDDHSQDMAEFILSEYKQPVQRISALVLVTPQAGKESVLYPQMLGRELTDRITVIDRPPGGGTENQDSYVIEGISHSFGPKYWETTFNLSPAYEGVFWQIGVPGFSEIGETTRVFF